MLNVNTESDRAQNGMRRINWARRGMSILTSIEARLTTSGAVKGKRVGICLVLEPKTANLVLSLRAAGAEVSVWAPADSTDTEVVDALRAEGVSVFADAGGSEDNDLRLAREFLSKGLDILVDDGAWVIRLAHREFPDLIANMIGAAEETTSGVRPLRMMEEAGELRLPVLAVNDSRLKYLFDNVYGTGQSCVMALLDLTNLQLAGRQILVIGYGWVGKGVALHAKALGAQVTVAEIDPVKALQAHCDGHAVQSIATAGPTAEVVFAATGISGVLTPDHVKALPDGAILCTAGGGDFELPMDYLRGLPAPRSLREAVEEYSLPDGKHVLLVAAGNCVNCAAAEGNPIEVMDLSLSLQACAIERLAGTAAPLPIGVHPISVEIENQIALDRLRTMGASTEPMTDALAAAMRQW